MKKLVGVGIGIIVLSLALAAATGMAQQPPSQHPMPQHGTQQPAGGMCPMMGGGMMGGAGMMGGMMGIGGSDARTLQMRGEMMRAMGEIMMKYGKIIEGGSK